MDKLSRTTLFFLLFCIVVVLQFQPAALERGQNDAAQDDPEKPLLSKILMDTVSLLRRSHKSSWEKIKTVIHDMQMQFSPPNLDFRGGGEGEPEEAHGGIKEAAGKSFDKSKEAVEESAKSAAKMVGEAIHATAEKVKERGSEKEPEAEL